MYFTSHFSLVPSLTRVLNQQSIRTNPWKWFINFSLQSLKIYPPPVPPSHISQSNLPFSPERSLGEIEFVHSVQLKKRKEKKKIHCNDILSEQFSVFTSTSQRSPQPTASHVSTELSMFHTAHWKISFIEHKVSSTFTITFHLMQFSSLLNSVGHHVPLSITATTPSFTVLSSWPDPNRKIKEMFNNQVQGCYSDSLKCSQ